MKQAKIVAITILAALGLIIVLQNTQSVETRILFVTITMPRAVLLFGTTLIGFVVGVLASLRMQRKKP